MLAPCRFLWLESSISIWLSGKHANNTSDQPHWCYIFTKSVTVKTFNGCFAESRDCLISSSSRSPFHSVVHHTVKHTLKSLWKYLFQCSQTLDILQLDAIRKLSIFSTGWNFKIVFVYAFYLPRTYSTVPLFVRGVRTTVDRPGWFNIVAFFSTFCFLTVLITAICIHVCIMSKIHLNQYFKLLLIWIDLT